MMALVQFASVSGDLAPVVTIDHRDWASLPAHPIAAVCIQGLWMVGYDEYWLGDDAGTAVFKGWADDPSQWRGQEWGHIFRFPPLAPDARGRLNTHITREVFSNDRGRPSGRPSLDELPRPSRPQDQRQGVYLSDASWAAHVAARPRVSWRHWED